MKQLKKIIITLPALLMALMLSAGMAAATEVERMTKEELVKIMDNDKVVILDVRSGRDWSSSEFKIKGAIREEPAKLDEWSKKYSKDQTLVLYCA